MVPLFVLFAGFIIGLGAVTVIDVHGFLGTTSTYWTQTTIRAHKITKPLIWLGTILAIIGGAWHYAPLGWTGTVPLQTIMAGALILNGLFLSFYVSPRLLQLEKEGKDTQLLSRHLKAKIAISFLVSFAGWWGSLALVVRSLV